MKRLEIVGWARELLDAPFHHQGMSVHGCDCVGLLRHIWMRAGNTHIELAPYPASPDGMTLMNLALKYGEKLPLDQAGIGDVLVFKFFRYPQHFGVISDQGMIHAYSPDRRVVETNLSPAWQRMRFAALRFPGLED